ncbi:hypothetical protein JB92DRAFT_2849481 [Gautieria morchelliformis]|nr:hypothetical protein JB92DRAFT_2849481 [Gautieria morchelliformis]
MDVPNQQGLVQWQFRGDVKQRARSLKLVALVLLGKLSPSVTHEDLRKHLQSVEIVQGDPTWSCTNWCTTAIQVLTDAGIISPGVGSAEIIATGKAFAAQHSLNLEAPIPTCRPDGVKIASEVTYNYV